jgi:hypothetical protein
MPPTIGAAIRFHTSDPVPVDHMIGIKPRNIVATVMNFGRSRLAAPSTMALEIAERRASVIGRCGWLGGWSRYELDYLVMVVKIQPLRARPRRITAGR